MARTTIDVEVGARVKARRVHLGMSRQRLAGALGVTTRQLDRYETGAERIGSARLVQIAELLGSPITSFFSDETDFDVAVLPISLVDVPGALGLLKAFADLEPEMRDVVQSLARSLVRHRHSTRTSETVDSA